MMVEALVIGALAGAAVQPLGVEFAQLLLESRGKTVEVSRIETIVTCIVLAIFGIGIELCAQTLPSSCFLFAMLLIVDIAAMTDFHCRVIPNELVLVLLITRLIFGIPALLGIEGFPAFDTASSLLGLFACLAIFSLPALAGKKVGAGDLKFVAAMGFCLGLMFSLYALALMGILVFIYMLYGKQVPLTKRLKQMIPMAPFACAAMMTVLLVEMWPAALL